MGEEVKKVEEAMVEEPKKEEAPAAVPEAEKKEEAAAAEGGEKKKEEAAKEPPPPPPPCILGIDLHCTGCANKIKRCLLRCKGVERVEVNMAQNQVMVKGIVDLQGICERLRKRTMRNATVISPPPPPPAEADAAAALKEEPVVVHSQVSEVTTVELFVNMHCEACAQQLQKKILKMRGVKSADANSGAGKLTVTGTMSADRLVQYIHRRTGKLATVVPPPPPPEPPKEEEPKKEDGDKKPEEPPAEGANNKEEQEKPSAEDAAEKKAAQGEKKEDGNAKPEDGAKKKEGGGDEEKAKPELLAVDGFPPEEMMKRMMYWPYPHKHYYNPQVDEEAMMAKRVSMVHPYAMSMMQWAPPPPTPPPPAPVAAPPTMYQYYNYGMVERPAPAPQYFSDENPNACVIS